MTVTDVRLGYYIYILTQNVFKGTHTLILRKVPRGFILLRRRRGRILTKTTVSVPFYICLRYRHH